MSEKEKSKLREAVEKFYREVAPSLKTGVYGEVSLRLVLKDGNVQDYYVDTSRRYRPNS